MNKICTSIEQSEKLMKFLPSESADMHYWKLDWNTYRLSVGHSKEWQEGYEIKKMVYIPCWSLTALLSVLPEGTRLLKSSTGDTYHCDCPKGNIDKWHDNPVDACVEMVCKLHERKLI